MTIVEIEGDSLTALRRKLNELVDAFASDHIWKISIAFDDIDGGFKIKVNGGVWSPSIGRMDR